MNDEKITPKKLTPEMAAAASEKVILSYAKELNLQTPEEVKQALEMLISKATRGIEKYCGFSAAGMVLIRTYEYLIRSDQAS